MNHVSLGLDFKMTEFIIALMAVNKWQQVFDILAMNINCQKLSDLLNLTKTKSNWKILCLKSDQILF